MIMEFKKAVKYNSKLRLGLIGVSGGGKTYTALSIAQGMGKKIAVIDTERKSASLYADLFIFDVLELETFNPRLYIEAIKAAEKAGYDVIIIDSLSHAWTGKDGALEMVDNASKRNSGNSFAGWREVTPLHNELIDTILQTNAHVIATMRAKTEYIVEEIRGKKVPRKIGLSPVQRDGMEYEFTLTAEINLEHDFVVSKTRINTFADRVINRAGAEIGAELVKWLMSGKDVPPSTETPEPYALERPKKTTQETTPPPDKIAPGSILFETTPEAAPATTDNTDYIDEIIKVFKNWGYKKADYEQSMFVFAGKELTQERAKQIMEDILNGAITQKTIDSIVGRG